MVLPLVADLTERWGNGKASAFGSRGWFPEPHETKEATISVWYGRLP
jgi:hypothetical protein